MILSLLNIEPLKDSVQSRWRRYSVLPLLYRVFCNTKVIGLVIAFLLTLAPLLAPVKASAWSGTLPSCDVGNALGFSWRSAIKAIDPAYDLDAWTGSVLIGTYDNDPVSTSFDLVVYVVNSATYNESVSGVKSVSLDTGKSFNITKNPASSSYRKSITSTAVIGYVTTSTLACITSSTNSIYPTAWTGVVYNSTIPQQEIACGVTDIQCRISQGFQGLTSDFSRVGQAIVNSIAGIFIPSPQVIQAQFVDLTSFMHAKLGFLTYPLDWFTNIFTAFGDVSNNWCNDTTCAKTFGNIFGTPYTFDFYVVKTSLPTYWEMFLLVFRSITVAGVLVQVYAVLKRTLQS